MLGFTLRSGGSRGSGGRLAAGLALAIAIAAAPPGARAERGKNRIGAIDSRDADGATVIRIRGTRTPTFAVYKLDRPARVVSGLITGWHAPGTSHLALLEAVAGAELVDRAYDAAVRERYLWHEFGDSCLLLP